MLNDCRKRFRFFHITDSYLFICCDEIYPFMRREFNAHIKQCYVHARHNHNLVKQQFVVASLLRFVNARTMSCLVFFLSLFFSLSHFIWKAYDSTFHFHPKMRSAMVLDFWDVIYIKSAAEKSISRALDLENSERFAQSELKFTKTKTRIILHFWCSDEQTKRHIYTHTRPQKSVSILAVRKHKKYLKAEKRNKIMQMKRQRM